MPKHYLRRAKLFRRSETGREERFNDGDKTWVNITPALMDWEFWADTELDEITEAEARVLFPLAF